MKIHAEDTVFCIPLVSENLESLTKEIEAVRSMNPDFVEWRVDYFKGSEEELKKAFEQVSKLRDFGIGVIFTPRDEREGGMRPIDRSERMNLIEQALAHQMNYIDLETAMPSEEREAIRGMLEGTETQVIASHHDFKETLPEEDIIRSLEESLSLGDLPKLAMMCENEEDYQMIRRAGARFKDAHPEQPIILIGMGEFGISGRVYPEELGSNLSFASGVGSSAPGQVSLDEIRSRRESKEKPQMLFLTGMMGCGKTTIGKRLSDEAGWTFIDLDEEIVRRDGRSIPEIFDQDTEAGFRRIERRTLEELAEEMEKSGRSAVIATGGGCVIDAENRKTLHRLGRIVWLQADPEIIVKRVEGDKGRPLLQGGNVKEKLQNLLEVRRDFYADCDLAIENLDPDATTKKLLNYIGA